MPYYEFFIYGNRKSALEEVQQTLVTLWEFDEQTALIRRPGKPRGQQAMVRLLNLIGIRHREDWLMTITGPEVFRERVYTIAEAWGGFCDGGGYDLGYDPSGRYSDEQIERHTAAWEERNREAETLYMTLLPEEEQARIRRARNDLSRHIQAHEDDEG